MSIFNGLILTSQRTLGTVRVDAVLHEDNESNLNITQFPLENGAVTTDHRIILPKRYIMEGVISDTNTILNLHAIAGFLGNGSSSVWDELVRLEESAELISITSGLTSYQNMMIEKLAATQDVDTANILRFTASLVEIRIVNSKAIQIPADKVAEKQRDQVSSNVNEGVKSKDDVGDINDDSNASIAIKAGRAIKRGFF